MQKLSGDPKPCEYFLQKCVPCLSEEKCYCEQSNALVMMACSRNTQDKPGCFDILDIKSETNNIL